MVEASNSNLLIVDHKYDAIKQMLIYVYSGATRFTTIKSTLELFQAAHQYELTELATKCEQFALNNLNRSNVIDCLVIAVKYDLIRLRDACLNLIVDEKRSAKINQLEELPNYDSLALMENYRVFMQLSSKLFKEIK